jgi:hypothetical protein
MRFKFGKPVEWLPNLVAGILGKKKPVEIFVEIVKPESVSQAKALIVTRAAELKALVSKTGAKIDALKVRVDGIDRLIHELPIDAGIQKQLGDLILKVKPFLAPEYAAIAGQKIDEFVAKINEYV